MDVKEGEDLLHGRGPAEEKRLILIIPCEIPGWAPMEWLVLPAVTVWYGIVWWRETRTVRSTGPVNTPASEAFQWVKDEIPVATAGLRLSGGLVLLTCKVWKQQPRIRGCYWLVGAT